MHDRRDDFGLMIVSASARRGAAGRALQLILQPRHIAGLLQLQLPSPLAADQAAQARPLYSPSERCAGARSSWLLNLLAPCRAARLQRGQRASDGGLLRFRLRLLQQRFQWARRCVASSSCWRNEVSSFFDPPRNDRDSHARSASTPCAQPGLGVLGIGRRPAAPAVGIAQQRHASAFRSSNRGAMIVGPAMNDPSSPYRLRISTGTSTVDVERLAGFEGCAG
jgi:hypothetical protein